MSTNPRPEAFRTLDERVSDMINSHAKLKSTNGRGTEVPSQLSVEAYVRQLEAELKSIRDCLDAAYPQIDSRDFRKASHHLDRAQQRMHKVIKKLGRKR